MAKRAKKSLTSLIGNREINTNEIEKAAAKVHKAKTKKIDKPVSTIKEKKVRVSVDTPVSLYMKSKEAALEEGSSLKDFMLNCVTAYLKEKGRL